MNLYTVIENLFKQGVDLWVSDGQLRFRAPKGVLTPELKDQLSQNKEKILTMLSQEGDSGPALSGGEGTIFFYPLSFAQKTSWFLYQLSPDSAAYNMSFAVRLKSELDIAAFRNALQIVVDRHPAFRTTYTAIDGGPLQLLHEHQTAPLTVSDASGWNQETLQERVHEEIDRPFDLEQGPILQAHLYSQASDSHVFLLAVHHIALDLWSLEMVIADLCALYAAQKAGTSAVLPPLEAQYKDYVRWQLEALSGAKGDQLRAYWRQQLSGKLPVLNLPTDRPRPAVQTYNTDLLPYTLDQALTEQMKAFVKTENVSLYTLLVAVFFILLHRYTGQDDILLGAPTSGRSQTKFQEIVGYFVNPIVLRADFSGNPTGKAFLQKMHRTVLASFDHQDYPSHLLSEELHLDHDPSHPQLFQAIFMLQELHKLKEAASLLEGKPGTHVTIGGLEMEPVDLKQETMIFVDLLLMVYEKGEQISMSWQYNADLFYADRIERMAAHFRILLESILADPRQTVDRLNMLSETERIQLLKQEEHPKSGIDETQLDQLTDDEVDNLLKEMLET